MFHEHFIKYFSGKTSDIPHYEVVFWNKYILYKFQNYLSMQLEIVWHNLNLFLKINAKYTWVQQNSKPYNILKVHNLG